MACRPGLVWAGIIAAGVAAEAHGLLCDHHDCTLSAVTRAAFRTEHPIGRAAFLLGTAGLALWFQYHIITWQRENPQAELAEVFELLPHLAPEQSA